VGEGEQRDLGRRYLIYVRARVWSQSAQGRDVGIRHESLLLEPGGFVKRGPDDLGD